MDVLAMPRLRRRNGYLVKLFAATRDLSTFHVKHMLGGRPALSAVTPPLCSSSNGADLAQRAKIQEAERASRHG